MKMDIIVQPQEKKKPFNPTGFHFGNRDRNPALSALLEKLYVSSHETAGGLGPGAPYCLSKKRVNSTRINVDLFKMSYFRS